MHGQIFNANFEVVIRSRIKNSFLFNYLGIAIVLFMIPLFFFGFFLFRQFFLLLETKSLRSSSAHINNVFLALEQNMNHLNVLTDQINQDNSYSRFHLSENHFNKLNATNDLKTLNLLIPYVDTMYLAYHNDDYVYAPGVAYTTNAMREIVFGGNAESWRRFREVTETTRGTSVFYEERSKRLFIIHTIKLRSRVPYGVVIYQISQSFITDELRRNAQINGSDFYLLSHDNRIIMSSEESAHLGEAVPAEIAAVSAEHHSGIIRIEGIRFFFSVVTSQSTGLKYLSISPYFLVMEDLIGLRQTYFRTLALILTSGVILLLLSLKVNYLPLKKLMHDSMKRVPEDMREEYSMHLDTIRNAMDYLSLQNDTLSKRFSSEKEHLAAFYLRKLLKGEILDYEKFLLQVEELGLNLNYPYHRVSIVYSPAFTALPDKDYLRIVDRVADRLSPQDHLLDYRLHDSLVLIQHYRESNASLADVEEIQRILRRECDDEVSVGVSGIYERLSDVPHMYIESSVALESRYINGKNEILVYDFRKQVHGKGDAVSSLDMEKFKQAVTLCDTEKIRTFMHRFRQQLLDAKVSTAHSRLRGYDIYKTYLEGLKALPGSRKRAIEGPSESDFSMQMSFRELESLIIETVSSLKSSTDERKDQERREKVIAIETFVKQRFRDCLFSLQEAAVAFGLSQSGLSLFYKEATGTNINRFLSQLRIDEAKRLILNTDMTIDRIAREVGYQNLSSFIRRFKQLTGTTPGAFRDTMAEISV